MTAKDTRYEDPKGDDVTRAVTVTSAPGETNRIDVALVDSFGVQVHDPAGLTPSAPCVAQDPQTVVCPPGGSLSVTLALGDGDDTLTAFRATEVKRVTVDGGDGNDVLHAPAGTVAGGPEPTPSRATCSTTPTTRRASRST